MNKIEALKMICTGVEALIAIEEGSAPAPSENKADVPAVEKEEVPAVETVPTEEVASYAPMSEETLKGMGYADLKALAKNVGVSAKGTKSQLLKVLIEYFKNMEEETPVEAPPQEEVPAEVETDEEATEGEDTRAVVLRMIEENEMSDDDIREVLKDAGLSDKGKHEALIDKLVSAIDDGIIQLEDEEDDEPAPVEPAEVEAEEEEESNEPAITPERAKGIEKLMEEVDEQFKDGSLTAGDIREFLDQFGDVTIPKKVSADKLLELYKENVSMLVDDEGNVCEEGAYFINNVPYCCGRPLNVADDNTATCSVCGETYEFEEE